MNVLFRQKTILVTGGVGSIGSEIVRQVLLYQPKVVRIYDNNEHRLYELGNRLKKHTNVRFLLGDVRDLARVEKAMEDVDIVYHAAALKHVELSEYNPFETVKTNILGTQNVIDAALAAHVKKVITISTDKAVNPTCTMGATKLVAEKLTVAAHFHKGKEATQFAVVRFGNVLGTNGSVIPTWIECIKKGQPITITNPDMTRFMMTIRDAIELVFHATRKMKSGEIFILKMPSLKISDLAQACIQEYAPYFDIQPEKIAIEVTKSRLGEKEHESLFNDDNTLYASEMEDFYVIPPYLKSPVKTIKLLGHLTSNEQPLLTIPQIRQLLRRAHILPS